MKNVTAFVCVHTIFIQRMIDISSSSRPFLFLFSIREQFQELSHPIISSSLLHSKNIYTSSLILVQPFGVYELLLIASCSAERSERTQETLSTSKTLECILIGWFWIWKRHAYKLLLSIDFSNILAHIDTHVLARGHMYIQVLCVSTERFSVHNFRNDEFDFSMIFRTRSLLLPPSCFLPLFRSLIFSVFLLITSFTANNFCFGNFDRIKNLSHRCDAIVLDCLMLIAVSSFVVPPKLECCYAFSQKYMAAESIDIVCFFSQLH